MSVDLVSLPEILASVPRDEADNTERDKPLSPCTDKRSLLRDVDVESRLRGTGDATPRASVALIPSSPTVACRMSSKNVHRPSRKSDAICLPVRMSASRDGGGIVFRHCEIVSSVGSMDDGPATTWFELRSVDDGSVADRGGLFITSFSGFGAGLLKPESVEAETNDSVRACDP